MPVTKIITLTFDGLTCAHCAQRLEDKLNKIKGVKASVSIFTNKLILTTTEELTLSQRDLLKDVKKICHKIEPDMELSGSIFLESDD